MSVPLVSMCSRSVCAPFDETFSPAQSLVSTSGRPRRRRRKTWPQYRRMLCGLFSLPDRPKKTSVNPLSCRGCVYRLQRRLNGRRSAFFSLCASFPPSFSPPHFVSKAATLKASSSCRHLCLCHINTCRAVIIHTVVFTLYGNMWQTQTLSEAGVLVTLQLKL